MPEMPNGEISKSATIKEMFKDALLGVEEIIKKDKAEIAQKLEEVMKLEKESGENQPAHLREKIITLKFEIGASLRDIEEKRAYFKNRLTGEDKTKEELKEISKLFIVDEAENEAKKYMEVQTAEFEKNGF